MVAVLCPAATLQKSIPTMVVQKNAAIDPMYIGGHKKCHNRRHIAAVFVPAAKKSAAIVQFFCSVKTHDMVFQLKNY